MDITLEKIDQVRDRTGVAYKDAKQALEVANGSVIDAIILIEEKQNNKGKGNFSETGAEILEKLKEIVKKGNVTKIILKKNEEIIMNIPVTAGAIGAVLAPPVAMLGMLTALIAKCRIEIVKTDGEIVDINEITEGAIKNVKSTAEDTFDHVKSKMDNYKSKFNENEKDSEIKLKKHDDEE